MSLTTVLSPHPPLLFRELGGLVDPVADLRAACLGALRAALDDGPEVVVVVGPVDDLGSVDADAAPDVRRFGTTGPPFETLGRERIRQGLPLSLGVGRRLLDDAGWTGPIELRGLSVDAGSGELRATARDLVGRPGRTLVLALGDGSARRDATGPGTLDERAPGFDARIAAALRDGDAETLAGLDVALAQELMVLGRSTLRLLGELGRLRDVTRAGVGHDSAPYGVGYLVATWSWRT
jgi:hypothetical protein